MFIIKVVLIVCVALFWISLFYNLIIKNIVILGKHTDVIRNMLSKDLNKQFYGSYYFFHILSYGILFDAYNNSKNNQYVAYLLELLCVFVRYIIFITLTCQCIIYIIIIFRVFN